MPLHASDLREAAIVAKRLLTGTAASTSPVGDITIYFNNFAAACLNAMRPATPIADWLAVTTAKSAELSATGYTGVGPGSVVVSNGRVLLLLDGLGTMFYQMLFLAYTLPTSVLSTADKTILLTQFNTFYPDP